MLERLTPTRITRSIHFRARRQWARLQSAMANWRRRLQLRRNVRRNLSALEELRRTRAGKPLVGIVLAEHLGDIVACEPVIRHVRSEYPDATLVWVVGTPYLDLVASHPLLDSTIEVSSLTEAMMLAESQAFDRVINLHINGRRCGQFGTVVAKTTGDPRITIENYFDFGSLLESFCRSAGLPPLNAAPELHLPRAASSPQQVRLPTGPYLVLHAGSKDGFKDWPAQHWRELVDAVSRESPLKFVEVGLASMIAGNSSPVIDACGRLSLPELAHVIAGSAGFIGIDSGPAHIANALRTRSLILLGHYAGWQRHMPYTGFLREHAAEMLLQWDGPIAALPVANCLDRVHDLWPEYFGAGAGRAANVFPTHG